MSEDLKKIASRIASGTIRTAGRIEFVRDQGPVRRNIRVQGFAWNPDRLRELSKILWACERSHGYAISALRLFSKMPAADFSPDGLMGGVGYIQSVKDMRTALGQSVEMISNFCDTFHDEVNAPHWAASIGDPEVQNIMEDTMDVKNDPEGFVEQQYNEEIHNPNPDDYNPSYDSPESDNEDDDGGWGALYAPVGAVTRRASPPHVQDDLGNATGLNPNKQRAELPTDDSIQKEGLSEVEAQMNTTWEMPPGNYASAIARLPGKILGNGELKTAAVHVASSSIPVSTLPGPRVDHIGPAEGGEFGYFNGPEDWPSDDPAGEGFSSYDYIYEGDDANPDGTTGYSDPSEGDVTVLKAAQRIAAGTYSWLPGSRNEKLMNYYEPGLTEAEISWMRAHDEPELPPSMRRDKKIPSFDNLWERLV